MNWIFLDSGPAGLVCDKQGARRDGDDLRIWLLAHKGLSTRVLIPEIVDYEVRRELLRAGVKSSVDRLDRLYADGVVKRLPITTSAMLLAAESWAEARNSGRQTADDRALDGDVILSAQARDFSGQADDWIILTGNVEHIKRYVGDRARLWQQVIAEWQRSSTSILE